MSDIQQVLGATCCSRQLKLLRVAVRVRPYEKVVPKKYKDDYPHKQNDQTRDIWESVLPEPSKYFVTALEKMPDVLSTTDGIIDYFAKEAHKRCFLDTIVYFIKSLKDLYAIC